MATTAEPHAAGIEMDSQYRGLPAAAAADQADAMLSPSADTNPEQYNPHAASGMSPSTTPMLLRPSPSTLLRVQPSNVYDVLPKYIHKPLLLVDLLLLIFFPIYIMLLTLGSINNSPLYVSSDYSSSSTCQAIAISMICDYAVIICVVLCTYMSYKHLSVHCGLASILTIGSFLLLGFTFTTTTHGSCGDSGSSIVQIQQWIYLVITIRVLIHTLLCYYCELYHPTVVASPSAIANELLQQRLLEQELQQQNGEQAGDDSEADEGQLLLLSQLQFAKLRVVGRYTADGQLQGVKQEVVIDMQQAPNDLTALASLTTAQSPSTTRVDVDQLYSAYPTTYTQSQHLPPSIVNTIHNPTVDPYVQLKSQQLAQTEALEHAIDYMQIHHTLRNSAAHTADPNEHLYQYILALNPNGSYRNPHAVPGEDELEQTPQQSPEPQTGGNASATAASPSIGSTAGDASANNQWLVRQYPQLMVHQPGGMPVIVDYPIEVAEQRPTAQRTNPYLSAVIRAPVVYMNGNSSVPVRLPAESGLGDLALTAPIELSQKQIDLLEEHPVRMIARARRVAKPKARRSAAVKLQQFVRRQLSDRSTTPPAQLPPQHSPNSAPLALNPALIQRQTQHRSELQSPVPIITSAIAEQHNESDEQPGAAAATDSSAVVINIVEQYQQQVPLQSVTSSDSATGYTLTAITPHDLPMPWDVASTQQLDLPMDRHFSAPSSNTPRLQTQQRVATGALSPDLLRSPIALQPVNSPYASGSVQLVMPRSQSSRLLPTTAPPSRPPLHTALPCATTAACADQSPMQHLHIGPSADAMRHATSAPGDNVVLTATVHSDGCKPLTSATLQQHDHATTSASPYALQLPQRSPSYISQRSESAATQYTTVDDSDNAWYGCNICLEEFAEGEMVRHLCCLHQFHSACINSWLLAKNSCPICRLPVYVSIPTVYIH